jgi:hypothetical protein
MATLQRHDVVDALQVLQYLERADQLERRLRITPNVATYFSNRGFANVRWLVGGLDAWCRDVGDAVLRSSLDSTTEDDEPDL